MRWLLVGLALFAGACLPIIDPEVMDLFGNQKGTAVVALVAEAGVLESGCDPVEEVDAGSDAEAGPPPAYTDTCWPITDPELDTSICGVMTFVECLPTTDWLAEHCYTAHSLDWNKDGVYDDLDGENLLCCHVDGY